MGNRAGDVSVAYATSIATVASRWVLEQPAVAAVIIGARNANHLPGYEELFRIRLTDRDRSEIEQLRRRMHTHGTCSISSAIATDRTAGS